MRLGLLALTALTVFAASSASAQRRTNPLEHYSDGALLREMSYRGYSCEDQQPTGPQAVLGISCNQFTQMVIDLYTEDGAKITSTKYHMGSESKCESEKARIMTEVGRRISRPKTVAYCNQFTQVVKLQFTVDSVKETEKSHMGSEQLCVKTANDFNEMF